MFASLALYLRGELQDIIFAMIPHSVGQDIILGDIIPLESSIIAF